MTTIPPNLARVPNLLVSSLVRDGVTRAGVDLLRTQDQLSSGKRISRGSDDPIAASLAQVVGDRLRTSDQRLRNFEHASAALATLDQALGEAANLALEARTLASDQVGAGSDSGTRRAQATVVESLIQELFALSNSRFADVHLLGGERTGAPPIERFLDGFRYVGAGDGLITDLGDELNTPITINAERALGTLSARVEGDVDLNPALARTTLIEDLNGARGVGVALGTVSVDIFDGVTTTTVTVDLTGADDVGDVLDRLESDILAADPAAFDGGSPYPGGVDVNATGTGVEFNVAAGYTITVSDIGGGTTAADLGLDGGPYAGVAATGPGDVDPRLSPHTTFGQLNPLAPFTPGDIVFNNGGRQGTVTVTAGLTIAEFARAVEALGIGARVEIAEDGQRLRVLNEVSGWSLSIQESGAGTLTATSLGIRSLQATTPLSVLNNGRGVEIADGQIDPVSGLPDAARNVDFEITLTDGTVFTVDLVPADITDVASLLAKINAEAALAGVTIGTGAGEFEALLADGGNGIVLSDNLGGAGVVSIRSLNGHAAEDLGLLDGAFTPGAPATFAGSDRSTVRVDSLFATLIDLKTALETNDVRGITFAGERLEEDIDRLLSARAVAGGRASRIQTAQRREEDANVLDQTVKSGLEDLDYAEATSRFAFLQLVQQAGYAAAGRSQALTLIDFLR